MGARDTDLAILGGGLAGGLIALALSERRPDLSVLLIEQADILGGNHVWSFFDSDVANSERALVEPLISHRWSGYSVRFPGYVRDLDSTYNSIRSAHFDAVLRERLGDRVMTGARVAHIHPDGVTLSDGKQIAARGVIDARGAQPSPHLSGGWQKFVGQTLKLAAPHGLVQPVVMDADVSQIDGYRFVYCLPTAADEVFVEDTYYSDTPDIDAPALRARIEEYAAAQGWHIAEVLGEESGVLPVVTGGDFYAFWGDDGIAKAGMRAALAHPLTSYSLPDAVRMAAWIAATPDLSGVALALATRAHAAQHWRQGGFYRLLGAMLFGAAEPDQRWRVLARFYRLSPRLIERFYAGRSTLADKARILAGKPPVPLGRAIATIAGGAHRPGPLTSAAISSDLPMKAHP